MSMTIITVGGQTINLVALPTDPPAPRTIQWNLEEAVALAVSEFSSQSQAQQWAGADLLSGVAAMPPLTQDQADNWIAFLMQCRGQANAFQMGDPLRTSPNGSGGALTANGAQAAGSQMLAISGGSGTGVLLVGDWVQIGYRLYKILDQYDSGDSAVGIWPSLREDLAGGESLILENPVGLFRLAKAKRGWQEDVTRYTNLSFALEEYR